MKTLHSALIVFVLLVLSAQEAKLQTPTYNMHVMNMKYYGCPSNTLEFDIYIEHTNSETFSYALGQFFFNFNPAIANGGTLSYTKVGSEFPSLMIPGNTQISGSQLRMAGNFPPGPNNGLILTNNGYPGTKIVRMRLSTSATEFAAVPLNLQWRNEISGNPYTKIYAYIGSIGVEITTSNTHTIDNFPAFTCDNLLLNAPIFNSPTNPAPVSFQWNSTLNATQYKLQVSTNPNFSSYVYNDSGITNNFETVSGLTGSTLYYWRVMSGNNSGYNQTSQIWYFNTGFPNNAQVPTYNLTVRNFVLNSPDDNQVEFDIYMEHTNVPATLEFALGQYFFNFNPAIANGGTLTYSIVGSDLPVSMQPRNPTVSGDQLRLASNQMALPGFGFNMTNNGSPGTKIVRMRLSTSAPSFANEPLNLVWRNVNDGSFYTKIFANVGLVGQQIFSDITTYSTHTVLPNNPLPVELAAFSSSVNRNDVTLNWTTNSEINNSGFEIGRAANISPQHWDKVGSVTGSGTTNESRNYFFTERVATGKYKYRLKQIDYNSSFEYFNLSNEVEVGISSSYELIQNYPNPFNPTTKFDYQLPDDGMIKINLYDLSGRQVKTLVNEFKTAGYYTMEIDGSGLSSGIYYYRLEAPGFSMTRKMMLVK